MNAFSGFTHTLQRHKCGCFGNTPAQTCHVSVFSHILYNLATAFLVLCFLSVLCKRTHSKSYCETSSFMSTLGVVNQVLLKHKMNSCCDLSTLVHLGYRDSKCATQVQVGYLSSPMQAPCLSFNPSISDQVTSPHPQNP